MVAWKETERKAFVMDSKITYVEAEKFEGIVKAVGFEPGEGPMHYQAQTAFVKISGHRGHAVYVSRNQAVGRVDVSGFGVDMPGVVDLGERAFGRVRQQLDMTLSEEEILRHFEALLVVMKHLPDQVRSPRTSRKAEAPRAPARPPMVERRSRPRIARPLESLSRS